MKPMLATLNSDHILDASLNLGAESRVHFQSVSERGSANSSGKELQELKTPRVGPRKQQLSEAVDLGEVTPVTTGWAWGFKSGDSNGT